MHIKLSKPVTINDGDITRVLTILRILPVLGTNKSQYHVIIEVVNHANNTWGRFEDIVDIKRIKELLNTKKKITIEE